MGLLNSLLGMVQGPAQQPPPNPYGFGYDPDGYLVHQPQGQPGALLQHVAANAPAQPLTSPAPPQATPQAPQGQTDPSGQPITVTGGAPDTWQPKHNGILGQIADYIIGTHFGKNVHRQNMEAALQDVMTDPKQAFNRMDKFDPEAAQEFYQHYVTNTRMQGAQDRMNRSTDLMTGRYADGIVGNMMNTALQSRGPDGQPDPAIWQEMRNRAMQLGERYNQDYSTIPDKPDASYATALSSGVIPAAKQNKLADDRDYRGQVMTLRRENFKSEDAYRKAMAAQGAQRTGIMGENAETAGQNADTREGELNTRQQEFGATHQSTTVRATDGRPGYGITSPDGKKMIWYVPDGTKHMFLRGGDGNHWVPTGQIQTPKKK